MQVSGEGRVKLEGVGQGGLPTPLPLTTINAVKGKSLYVDIEVEMVSTRFLVDSGAEISIIPDTHRAVADKRDLRLPTMQPVLADGSKLTVLGVVTLAIVVNKEELMVDFYVVSAHVFPILGNDIMRCFGFVTLDFSSHAVTFGPRVMTEPGKEAVVGAPRVSRVVLSEDIKVPGGHEIVVDGLVESGSPAELMQLGGQACVLESDLKEGGGVSVARVLGMVEDGRFPVRICNPLPQAVELRKNQRVGVLEMVEEPVVGVLSEEDDITDVMGQDTSAGEDQVLWDLAKEAEVPQRDQSELFDFLRRYKEVFSLHGELGRYDGLPFTIDTGDARPVRQMPRRVPHHWRAEVDKQLDQMLEQGVIKPSTSAWASPICLVRKRDGTLRFCVDYRKLNAVSKGDAYPVPHMGECLSTLAHSELYSIVDCISGYWQCGMDSDSAEKAAITTHRGLFQPTVLPFGVKGGVAHFSRVMSTLFGALQWRILLIYLDDLLIFSRNFKEHLHRLGAVFDCLLQAGLKLKPSKCSIARKSIKFLGHIVSREGVSSDPDKIKAITEFPVPGDVEQLRRFLGMAGYYRDYVDGFAEAAHPLNQLTRKGVAFTWSVVCSQAFRKLKELLVKAPVLAYPDFSREFTLTTDASNIGLGAILSQEVDGREVVISYASKSLSKAESNYSTTERECLAVVWAAQHFSHYLLGSTFVIRTDHDPLTYLRSVPSPHGRLARWIGWLEQFSYRMVYTPGKSIPHADALSRAPVVAGMEVPSEVSSEEVQREQASDRVIKYVVELWKSGKQPCRRDDTEVKKLFEVSKDFIYRNGTLCVKTPVKWGKGLQVVLPRSLVVRVLQVAHDHALSGHFAVERTLAAVRQRFYWGSMFKDVKSWCQSCEECQSRRSPIANPRAPLQFTPIPSRPWQMISLDFMGPLVESDEPRCNKHVLVVTDKLTKYAIALPLRDQTAETTACALFYQVFCVHSFPEFLHSDQGRNFESKLMKRLCELTGIEKTRTTPYHPAGNGQTERYNRTMVEMLSKSINACTQRDWDEHLPVVQFAYNTSVHSSTGIQPFQLHFGRESKTLLDLAISCPGDVGGSGSAQDCLRAMRARVRQQIRMAQEKIGESMVKQKAAYDKKGSFRLYEKGEQVMLREYRCPKGLKPKLWKDRWTGPWRVICRKSDVNYRIAKGEGRRRRKVVVHHNRLKPYVQRPPQLTGNAREQQIQDEEDGRGQINYPRQATTGFSGRAPDWEEEDEDEPAEEVNDEHVEEVNQPNQPEIEAPVQRGHEPFGLRNRGNILPPVRYR